MLAAHRYFRKLFNDAPSLVRSVNAGDTAHATAVADHLDFMVRSLHAHHQGEDIVLWDELSERAPACAIHVEQMKAQHAMVSDLLDQLEATLPQWRAAADAHDRELVVVAVEHLRSSLFSHLGDEETEILPAAGPVFTQREWDSLGEHYRASIPPGRMLIDIGYILDSMTPEEGKEWMRSTLPAPARLLYRLIGKRQYEAEQRALRPHAA